MWTQRTWENSLRIDLDESSRRFIIVHRLLPIKFLFGHSQRRTGTDPMVILALWRTWPLPLYWNSDIKRWFSRSCEVSGLSCARTRQRREGAEFKNRKPSNGLDMQKRPFETKNAQKIIPRTTICAWQVFAVPHTLWKKEKETVGPTKYERHLAVKLFFSTSLSTTRHCDVGEKVFFVSRWAS